VAATCSVFAPGVVFGTYTGTAISVTGTVTVICPSGTAYSVGLNAGMGSGATTTTRKMTNGASTLNYQMFQNSGHTTNWGNIAPIDTVQGMGNGSQQSITIFALLPAGQTVPPNSYTDTITASVTSLLAIATAQFSVTATAAASCQISAGALGFGNYSGLLINASSTVMVTCASGTTYNVGLNAGTATGATVSTRKMTGPALATLDYTLFRDSARTMNWGVTVGTDTVSGTGNGAAQPITVFGRLPAGQSPNPGSYTDTITATLTF
jgi:spore coat protein U-like protein